MTNDISLENIKKIVGKVKHPTINETLLNLGIIKEIKIKNNKANIVLAFPFENIPIKEQLIESVKKPLEKLKIDVSIKIIVMDHKELQKFLIAEQKYWEV